MFFKKLLHDFTYYVESKKQNKEKSRKQAIYTENTLLVARGKGSV